MFLLSLVSLVTFGTIVYLGYPDIPDHNRFITGWLGGDENVKVYSLYFFVVMTLAFFQNNTDLINVISVVVLCISVIVKYLITVNIFNRELFSVNGTLEKKLNIGSYSISVVAIIQFIVLLVCLAENWIYKRSATMALGYIPVNSWHNSTTIFLMPVAVLLFYKSYLFFRYHDINENNFTQLWQLAALSLFSVLIKPSYFFVFSIAFPVTCLIRFGINKVFLYTILVVVISSIAVFLIYYYVYVGSSSSVAIRPFYVWRYWSDNILLGLISSIVFPVLILVFYGRQAIGNLLLGYAWIHLIVAVIIYILLSETGGRELHGNFGWQTIICNFVLFFCSWIVYLKILLTKKSIELKDKLIVGSFLVHVLTGLIYIVKLPFYGPG